MQADRRISRLIRPVKCGLGRNWLFFLGEIKTGRQLKASELFSQVEERYTPEEGGRMTISGTCVYEQPQHHMTTERGYTH
jgi:hypothetical protein